MNEWIKSVLDQPKRIAIPIMTHPGIEMIGESVLSAVTNGDVHFEAIKALAETYPSAATTVIMDLTVEAEAFGCEINFTEDEVPAVSKRLVYDAETIEALQIPTLEKGRVPEYIKANKLTAEYVSEKPVLTGCIGPYSLAGRLYDMTEIMTAIYIDPESIHLLLEKCTQFIKDYCIALKETGVNGIVIAEPAAGLLGNDECMEYSSKYIKTIIDEIQDENFKVILHNCGNTGQCTQAMLSTGAAGYHFGNAMNMVSALKDCPQDVLVMGNLNPVGVLKMMTPEKVKTETLKLLEQTASFPNFVLSSGCDMPPFVPKANIEAFFNALNQFNN